MPKTFLITFIYLTTLIACQPTPNQENTTIPHQTTLPQITPPSINWEQLEIELEPQTNKEGVVPNYDRVKQLISENRKHHLAIYQTTKDKAAYLDTIRYDLTEQLLNDIIPYWYGTPWDFNGHTDIPKEGEIACGYFVSTTLKHLGFKLNRYKMAQQSAASEIKTLQTEQMIWLNQEEGDNLESYLNNHLQNGLYVIGLDFHVGYLLKRQGQGFFIHSNYVQAKGVMIEPIAESVVLAASKTYAIGDITHNDNLLKKWLFQQKIPIVLD